MSLETWKAEFYPVEASEVPKEQAVAHSLQKWKGLSKENLERHDIIADCGDLRDAKNDYFDIDSDTCALCVHYSPDGTGPCTRCPLRDVLGKPCFDGRTSPYKRWSCNHDPAPMIAALEKAMAEQGGGGG